MAHARVFFVAAVIAASALAPGRGQCAPQCPDNGSSDAAQGATCAASPPAVAAGQADAAPASKARDSATDSIYKCTDANGAEVLQNSACSNDSGTLAEAQAGGANAQGAPPAAPPREAPAADPADSAAPMAPPPGFTGEPAAGAAPAAEDPASLPSEPALGMTPGEVQAILGPPLAVTQEEVVQGRVVTWIYGDSRTLQFDASGRLSSK